jgi:hypothetical protein
VPFTLKLYHYDSKGLEYIVYFARRPNFSDIQSDAQEDCQYWGMYGRDTLFNSLDDNDDVCYLCTEGGALVCCEVGATCSNLIIP